MGQIAEVVQYDENIYEIETTDAVIGGSGGIANQQAQGLANRTAWLNSQLSAEETARANGDTAEATARAAAIAVLATQIAAINSAPSGIIVMWSGAIKTIPSGWNLCDGTNGTPNLSGRFIVGYCATANANYTALTKYGITPDNTIGDTGGANGVELNINQIPPHTHNIPQGDSYTGSGASGIVGRGGANLNTMETESAGGVSGGVLPFDNRPPYYVLAFIMKS
jgi:hypothetical protein